MRCGQVTEMSWCYRHVGSVCVCVCVLTYLSNGGRPRCHVKPIINQVIMSNQVTVSQYERNKGLFNENKNSSSATHGGPHIDRYTKHPGPLLSKTCVCVCV